MMQRSPFRKFALNITSLPRTLTIAALAASIVVLTASGRVAAAEPAPVAPAQAADGAFRTQSASFIEAELRLYPERATALGDHRYDDRIDVLSRSGFQAVIGHAKKWTRTFKAIDSKGLSADDEADREWLLAHLDGELLSAEQLRDYERDPGMYIPTSAVYSLVKRNFAPLEVRMASVVARETAASKNFAAARQNLRPERTPKVAIDIVLEQMPGTIKFFSVDLPQAFKDVAESPGKQAFRKANADLIAALEDYEKWLKNNLEPRALGNYAIGADAYRRMLADADMVGIPLARLEQVGEKELARLQDEFRKTAAQIDPHREPADIAAAMGREHPAAEQVIPTVTDGLAAIRAYVIAHKLATIPSAVMPVVRETPPYARATTFASMDSPGPFEKTTEAYFYVTLPDPAWPDARKQQLLAFYSPPTISDTSVHEVFPGHYVQFLNNRLNTDRIRQIYRSGANAEGWALYCEQMMLDEGLHSGDAKYRFAQVQMALLRACRYLVGLRMHTHDMTVDQAAAFFEKSAYLTPQNARMEALRGTEDPGYLRYQLGKLMILKLREDVRAKQGAAFDLGKFHDAFLAKGGIPIVLIRRAMLGNDGPML
ncbi:MAG TPA: DUF885 domain-containing protein [Candidatus Binataceae bacterium]